METLNKKLILMEQVEEIVLKLTRGRLISICGVDDKGNKQLRHFKITDKQKMILL